MPYPLLSPRKNSFNAWQVPALALVKAKSRFNHTSGVLISAFVLHGPDDFFAKFAGPGDSSATEFVKRVEPLRSTLFTGRLRMPTDVALLCLTAASNLAVVKTHYSTDENLQAFLVASLQKSLATSAIYSFCPVDRVDHIARLVQLICTMSEWTDPRGALLGPNHVTGKGQVYTRELSVMGEMYECEPTKNEQDTAVIQEMIADVQGCGSVCGSVVASVAWDSLKCLSRLLAGTPAAPAPPQKEWTEELYDTVVNGTHFLIWLSAMIYVIAVWLDGIYAPTSSDATQADMEFTKRVSSSWDVPGLIYVFVMTHWRGTQSAYLFSIFVGMLSLSLACQWQRIMLHTRLAHRNFEGCWDHWKTSTTHVPASEFCDNGWVYAHMLMTYCHYTIARLVGLTYWADLLTMVLAHYRNISIQNPNDNPDAMWIHIPRCARVSAVYILMHYLYTWHKMLVVFQTLNIVVFVGLFLQSLHRWHAKNSHGASLVSLYASRLVCILVVATEIFNSSGYENPSLQLFFIQLQITELVYVHSLLFWYYLAAHVYKLLFPDSHIHIMCK